MKAEFIAEWDYEKNGSIDPRDIPDHSNKKYFWRCPKGHPSYCTSVSHRSRGNGCPVCSNHKIIKGINDFESLHPELMGEWMWEENDSEHLKPDTISQGSGRIAWWKCKTCGNSWKASIVNRARKHSGCPYCANLKVKKGFNDLESVKPELAKEWDYEKNAPLDPDFFSRGSNVKAWWICKEGHTWQAQISNRCHGSGCPVCYDQRRKAGLNRKKT